MEEVEELTPQEVFDQQCPLLYTLEDLTQSVFEDPENLVCVFVLAPSFCVYSNKMETTVIKELSTPQPATSHARFFRVHLEACDVAVPARLGDISHSPCALFFLKGAIVAQFNGSNGDKLAGIFRNTLIKRNEDMREYDEAKLAAMQPADEEAEEGEDEDDE